MTSIITYRHILPVSLHKETEGFLYYLKTFPFEKPQYCIYCGSKMLSQMSFVSSEGIRSYQCQYCKKVFNQLTGTLFARGNYLDKWGDIVFYYLSGLSINEISARVNVPKSCVSRYTKKLLIIMQQEAPSLFNWWQKNRDNPDLKMNKVVETQKTLFLDWLKKLVQLDNIACPHCASHRCYRVRQDRPQFCCWHCLKNFNPLEKTPFRRMHFIHLWPIYFEKLTAGFLQREISVELTISRRSLILWKSAFIKQMELMELYALAQWMRWRNQRRSHGAL